MGQPIMSKFLGVLEQYHLPLLVGRRHPVLVARGRDFIDHKNLFFWTTIWTVGSVCSSFENAEEAGRQNREAARGSVHSGVSWHPHIEIQPPLFANRNHTSSLPTLYPLFPRS